VKKDWFKVWFESEYYQKVYSHRDSEDAKLLCELILKTTHLQKDAKILDAACGNGRHYINFSKAGFNVFGFDLSKNLLFEAKANSFNKKIPQNFFCSDIRFTCLKTRFDLITNLFTSFGYFDEDDENFLFIEKAFNLLNENGFYVLDYFNVEYLKNNLKLISEKKVESLHIKEERFIHENRINKKIIIVDLKNNSENENMIFYESVKLYKRDELIERISKYGFKLQFEFGNYYGEKFNLKSSERLILFFKK